MPSHPDHPPVRLLLVDDHQIMREGLRLLLRREPDFEVVGEAASGQEALLQTQSLHPHIVILDLGLPDIEGTALTRQLLTLTPTPRVVILSAHGDAQLLDDAIRAGAAAYILKASASSHLLEAIRTVAAGRMFTSPELSATLLSRYRELLEGRTQTAEPRLTGRETEVLQLIAQGLSTKEVAAQLDLSVKTIETHRARIMERLGLRSVAELTKYAIRKGLTTV